MDRHYYEPWPVPPACGSCRKPATVSFYDEDAKETVVRHEDATECRTQGGSAFTRDGDVVLFEPVMGAEFIDLAEIIAWGREL